jgi:hypothetical protein
MIRRRSPPRDSCVARADTSPTTRVLHRLYRVVAGRAGHSRFGAARNACSSWQFRARAGCAGLTSYRSVTPEVAGSSPVAPVSICSGFVPADRPPSSREEYPPRMSPNQRRPGRAAGGPSTTFWPRSPSQGDENVSEPTLRAICMTTLPPPRGDCAPYRSCGGRDRDDVSPRDEKLSVIAT